MKKITFFVGICFLCLCVVKTEGNERNIKAWIVKTIKDQDAIIKKLRGKIRFATNEVKAEKLEKQKINLETRNWILEELLRYLNGEKELKEELREMLIGKKLIEKSEYSFILEFLGDDWRHILAIE